ncbi:MAG: RraA family protein [Terriglobia bacterium]|jgi:regulator of RNase E activity RraA
MEALPVPVLDHLGEFTSPTVANAIEVFNVRPRHEGFMRPEIRCVFPQLGVMVGYAVTLKIRAATPGAEGETVHARVHWEKVLQVPSPRVVVVEDLDDPPGLGSYWGEVNANVHLALGCVGVVTNGAVRDLEEVAALRFHFFAAHIAVSHAYVHIVEAGTPVRVGGLTVRPGDLLHADQHGVVNVPRELAAKIPEGARKVADMEHRIIAYSQSAEFTLEGLDALWRSMRG